MLHTKTTFRKKPRRLGGAPNPTQPKSMGKTYIRPSQSSAIFKILSTSQLVSHKNYIPQETATPYYFRFLLGVAPNPTRPKSMGLKAYKTIICLSNTRHILRTFEHWPTCSTPVLHRAKNRDAILLPVSPRWRSKPDTAKVKLRVITQSWNGGL